MREDIIKEMKKYSVMATWHISNAVGMRGKTSIVLKELKKMESDGIVIKKNASTPNNYCWSLVK